MLVKKLSQTLNSCKSILLNRNLKFLKSKPVYTRKMRFNFDPALKGTKELNKDLFKTQIKVTAVKIKKNDIIQVRRLLKSFSFDSVVNCKRFTIMDPGDNLFESHKYIFLDPETFNYEKLDPKIKEELKIIFQRDESKRGVENPFENKNLDLEYNDIKFDDVIKAIIPDDLLKENVNIKGYSIIGHVAHFNLKENILEYKHVIGQVLIDKVTTIKTVVNKLSSIDNTYRNFELEVLAGPNDTMVQCKENNCHFRFDFAKVYWNPRLGTEHERIVNMLKSRDVLYDVFAGVGPFSIPAISNKKLQAVLANDLNPNSFRYLLDNYTANNKSKMKKKEQELKRAFVRQHPAEQPILKSVFHFSPSQDFLSFNLDGRQFIEEKLKYHFIEILNYLLKYKPDEVKDMKFYVLMNLPAMSVEFLDAFKNLYDREESTEIKKHFNEDILENVGLNINCYHFSKTLENELEKIQERIKKEIIKDESLDVNSRHVRNVAPNKEMYVTTFNVKFKHLLTNEENEAIIQERNLSSQNVVNKKFRSDPKDGEQNVEIPQKVAKLAHEINGIN